MCVCVCVEIGYRYRYHGLGWDGMGGLVEVELCRRGVFFLIFLCRRKEGRKLLCLSGLREEFSSFPVLLVACSTVSQSVNRPVGHVCGGSEVSGM